ATDSAAAAQLETMRLDPAPVVRARLVALLARRVHPAPLPLLESLADDPAPEVAGAALVGLLQIGDDQGLLHFATVWQRAAPGVRRNLRGVEAAAALVPSLATALRTRVDASLRVAAARALGALSPPGFEQALVASLGDPAPEVRIACAESL